MLAVLTVGGAVTSPAGRSSGETLFRLFRLPRGLLARLLLRLGSLEDVEQEEVGPIGESLREYRELSSGSGAPCDMSRKSGRCMWTAPVKNSRTKQGLCVCVRARKNIPKR